MARGKAEDAGGLTPAKDDNAAPYHFAPPNFTDFQVCRLYARCSCQGALCAVFLTPPHAARYLGLVALTSGHGYLGGGAPYNLWGEHGGSCTPACIRRKIL